MNKQSDRIKRWRERQKAEGKASFTVLLSQEGREILVREKEKTGESYAVIIEKALTTMEKHGYRQAAAQHLSRHEGKLRSGIPTKDRHQPLVPVKNTGSEKQPKLLIDDFANYPLQAVEDKGGIYHLQTGRGIFGRILQSSMGSFPLIGRKKRSR